MHDRTSLKDYLKLHGIEDVDNLDYEETKAAYRKCVEEGVKYFNDLLKSDNAEIVEEEEIKPMEKITSIEQIYSVLYEFLHIHTPNDMIAIMAESKIPVSYKQLQQIVKIVHARIQNEILDTIALDLQDLPVQERETLLAYYDTHKEDIAMLESVHNRYKSHALIDYAHETASMKLEIIQTYLSKFLEIEYKPYYDGTQEKKQIVKNILGISSVYSKDALFDMTISELDILYQTIVEQNKQKERMNKMLKKYIEIFEDAPNLSDAEFKANLEEALRTLNEESMHELIAHFEYKNHFVTNKMQNIIRNYNNNI